MNLQLQGLTAVVTGGSSGIGAAIVRAFAAEGCKVWFCARTEVGVERMVESASKLPGKVNGAVLDATDAPAVTDWLRRVGEFDIFVPNVSALSGHWEAAISVDIAATVAATEAAIPYLQRSSNAAITYISSKAASLASPRSPAYGASKAAMVHYMKSLATALLPKVRVNSVSPGDTLAPDGFWDRVRQADPESFKAVVQRNPLGRLASPEEIARVVVFISSPVASFVAGANWYVDGGSIAHVQA